MIFCRCHFRHHQPRRVYCHPEAVAFVTLSPLIIRSCRFCHPFRSYHIPFTRPRGAQGMSRAVMCQLVLPFPLTIASPESGFPWVLVVTVGWSSGDIPVSPIRIMLWQFAVSLTA